MRRATITLSDDLEADVDEFLSSQEPEPTLAALVQTALRRYLDEADWSKRGLILPAKPLAVTPVSPGSGRPDSSMNHDSALAERP